MDIRAVYLNAKLDEENYKKYQKGQKGKKKDFGNSQELYMSSKQSGPVWNETFDNELKKIV